MASSLYVLGTSTGGAVDGHVDLKAGEHISIHHWEKPDGTTAIPVFSSLAALQRAIDAESEYLKLPSRDFFDMTKGQGVFLNPRSVYGKEFVPEEIETLLAELSAWFAKHPGVRRAYLAMMHDPSVDDKPHYLVAVELTGDVETVMRGAGLVAGDASPDGPVDLLRLGQNGGGLESHITAQFKPFYVRSMKQRLLAMFGR